MTGKTIGRYTVLPKLGHGGMGEVYLAVDTSLQRKVALKILPPEAQADPSSRERLLREARAAAAIDHPYVCKIFEVGEAEGVIFIAMEFVEGETLGERLRSGPLGWQEAVRIAGEVAEALARAHEKGVVHRDLKPSNVMLAPDGHVKVLDFGLAKRVCSSGAELQTAATLTVEGALLGTPAYMSPEQARGVPVDHRTDIFSLGLLLYEMLSGHNPFQKPSLVETLAAILKETPPPLGRYNPDCPRRLEDTVARMLAKEAERRHPSAREVCNALRSISSEPSGFSATPRSNGLSIAVLPFANLSADPEQEYFSEGITEDIIAQLSKIPGCRVIARTSVMRYRNTDKDIAEIARELSVNNVLEGSVRRAGSRVRITTALVDASTNRQLWAEVYDRELDDIFAVQADVARQIAAALATTLSPTALRRLDTAPRDSEAYQLYLKGRYFLNRLLPDEVRKAIRHFQEALDLDPTLANSYAGLSTCYALAAHYDYMPPREGFPRAQAAARRALELDEQLAEAHVSMGLALMFYDWNWRAAENSFRRAISLDPNRADARMYYSWWLALRQRSEEAIAEARQAVRLDPLGFAATSLAWVLVTAGCFDEAIEVSLRTLEFDPNSLQARNTLGIAYMGKGMFEEGIREIRSWTWRKANLAIAYAVAGRNEEARAIVDEVASRPSERRPSDIAYVCALIGDSEQAARWLEKAYEERDYMLACHLANRWAKGHQHPILKAYLQRMGLET
jgi:serine/threonine protein kinase/tetratricopeptide (TPR) repeat protein